MIYLILSYSTHPRLFFSFRFWLAASAICPCRSAIRLWHADGSFTFVSTSLSHVDQRVNCVSGVPADFRIAMQSPIMACRFVLISFSVSSNQLLEYLGRFTRIG